MVRSSGVGTYVNEFLEIAVKTGKVVFPLLVFGYESLLLL